METMQVQNCQVIGCINTATVKVIPQPIDGLKESTHLVCDVHHSYQDENGVQPFVVGCTFERLIQN